MRRTLVQQGLRFCGPNPLVTGKRIAVLGFAFKADTNDTRETPAIRICRDLLEGGAQLVIFDPKVSPEQITVDLGVEALVGSEGEGVWQAAADPCAAVCGADAVLLLTEWQQFRQLDWPDSRENTEAPQYRCTVV